MEYLKTIKDLIEKMVQLVILKYEQEQALFEKELSEAKTVKEKIQIIDNIIQINGKIYVKGE